MDREDLENELKAQLQSSTNSNQFPSTRITSLIQNAYKRSTNLFIWRALTNAVKTGTRVKGAGDDECYYDYPSEFRTGTVYKIKIDGASYKRKSYETFLDYRENNSNSTEKIFAVDQRFIFVSPDTVAGTANMDIWGAREAEELTLSTSKTIFSDNLEEANFAIIGLALSVATKKSDRNFSAGEEAKALATLNKLNVDEWNQYQRDQPIDAPLLDVPDFFSGGINTSPIGNFSGRNFI